MNAECKWYEEVLANPMVRAFLRGQPGKVLNDSDLLFDVDTIGTPELNQRWDSWPPAEWQLAIVPRLQAVTPAEVRCGGWFIWMYVIPGVDNRLYVVVTDGESGGFGITEIEF